MVRRTDNLQGSASKPKTRRPIVWRQQIDGSLEGRTLGLDFVFWLAADAGRLAVSVFGQGREHTRSFMGLEQAGHWIDRVCEEADCHAGLEMSA